MLKDIDLAVDNIKLKTPNKDIMDFFKTKKTLIKRIYATRYNDLTEFKKVNELPFSRILSLEYLKDLKDIDEASDIIGAVISSKKRIMICSDSDSDGVTSAAIGHLMFKNIFKYSNFEVVVNRREFGNGINNTTTEILMDIHKEKPFDLLITSDHGSHDLKNLTILKKELGIQIIVTDHHLIEEATSPLKVVDAFVNPQRDDSTFSKKITGTVVLYFVLVYTLIKHFNTNYEKGIDLVYKYIAFAGLTTISDAMDLKEAINRKLVIKTIELLNSNLLDDILFWRLAKDRLSKGPIIDTTQLSFELIPMLNTPGRIGNPRLSFNTLIATNENKGLDLYDSLDNLNNVRKEKQTKVLADENHVTYSNGTVLVMLAENSNNIQGIVANNIIFNDDYKIGFVFAVSPTDDKILLGSGRMLEDPNNPQSLVDIIDEVAKNTGMVIAHGGHALAMGLKINNNLKGFYTALVKVLNKKKIKKSEPIIYVDEIIYSNKKLLTSILDIKEAAPYGIGFPKPLFVSEGILHAYRIIDKGPNIYMSGFIKLSEQSTYKIGFFYTIKREEKDAMLEAIKHATHIRIVYEFATNSFRGLKVQLNIKKLIPKRI